MGKEIKDLEEWDKVWHRNSKDDPWDGPVHYMSNKGTFGKPWKLFIWNGSHHFSAKYIATEKPEVICEKCHNDRVIAIRCCDRSDCGCMGAVVDVKHCPECNKDEDLKPSDSFKKSMPWFFMSEEELENDNA